MGLEVTLWQNSAWMITRNSKRTCSERGQIFLGLQVQEMLKLLQRSYTRDKEITKMDRNTAKASTLQPGRKAAILQSPGLFQSGMRLHLRVCSALSFHRKGRDSGPTPATCH